MKLSPIDCTIAVFVTAMVSLFLLRPVQLGRSALPVLFVLASLVCYKMTQSFRLTALLMAVVGYFLFTCTHAAPTHPENKEGGAAVHDKEEKRYQDASSFLLAGRMRPFFAAAAQIALKMMESPADDRGGGAEAQVEDAIVGVMNGEVGISEAAAELCASHYGPIDVLVFAAGHMAVAAVEETLQKSPLLLADETIRRRVEQITEENGATLPGDASPPRLLEIQKAWDIARAMFVGDLCVLNSKICNATLLKRLARRAVRTVLGPHEVDEEALAASIEKFVQENGALKEELSPTLPK